MDHQSILQSLKRMPIIAAIRSDEGLQHALSSQTEVLFLLSGDIMTLAKTAERVHDQGKLLLLHLDLLEGVGRDAAGIRFLARHVRPDGLISTRAQLLRQAANEGMVTVQRMFLVDSSSVETGISLANQNKPDFVELMPGLLPRTIAHMRQHIDQPIIAGGMITAAGDVTEALTAGALAVSTSNRALWRNE